MLHEGVPEKDRAELEARLDRIERDHGVRILFACESGSRAWGFASPDSDYDVRFIYANRREWYLSVSLEEQRDVIETPIEGLWDVNGWDLRKALRLYRKSNPPLLEWLQSPIVYRERGSAAERMRALLSTYFSPPAAMYHYLHMAQGNFRSYLQEERVRTKKYFYVLRPLVACRWVERGAGAAPTEFGKLLDAAGLEPEVRAAIDDLLRKKGEGDELAEGPRIEPLDRFIRGEFARHEANGVTRQPPRPDTEPLSELFRAVLDEVWADRQGA